MIKAKKPASALPGAGLEPKHYLLLIPLVFGVLICAQLIVGILGIYKAAQVRILNGKWQSLAAQKKTLEEFNSQYAVQSEDAQALQQLLRERIIWSEKLNRLSQDLPIGVWFRELSATPKELILRGAVVSLNKDELGLIKQLLDNLKNDPAFFRDFSSLELGSAEKTTLGSYEVTEFTLNANLRTR